MTPATLAMIHAQTFTTTRPWCAREFTDLLATKDVVLAGDARSFIMARITLDEAEILTLATAPEQQRKGLARAALRALTTVLRNRGATRIFLEVAEDNSPAIALYTSEGFTRIARRKNYYRNHDGTTVAAVVMEKAQDPADGPYKGA